MLNRDTVLFRTLREITVNGSLGLVFFVDIIICSISYDYILTKLDAEMWVSSNNVREEV